MIDMEVTNSKAELQKQGAIENLKHDITKRKGIFLIHADLVEGKEVHEYLTHVSPYVVIVGVEKDVFKNAYKYIGYSPLFDVIQPHEAIPQYTLEVEVHSDNTFKTIARRC